MLSLPSLLNFAYLNELTAELGPRSNDRSLPDYLLEHNRAVRFLRAKGYRFVFFPSQWWRATDHNGDADTEFRVAGDFSLRRALAGSELTIVLHRHTLLHAVGSLQPVHAKYIKRTFEGLRLTDTGGRPAFVFAHLILPHAPYVFDAHCQTPMVPRYVDQVRCTNLVTALLTAGQTSDHSAPGRSRHRDTRLHLRAHGSKRDAGPSAGTIRRLRRLLPARRRSQALRRHSHCRQRVEKGPELLSWRRPHPPARSSIHVCGGDAVRSSRGQRGGSGLP
jgi:hypothetical protein